MAKSSPRSTTPEDSSVGVCAKVNGTESKQPPATRDWRKPAFEVRGWAWKTARFLLLCQCQVQGFISTPLLSAHGFTRRENGKATFSEGKVLLSCQVKGRQRCISGESRGVSLGPPNSYCLQLAAVSARTGDADVLAGDVAHCQRHGPGADLQREPRDKNA